MGPVFNCEKAQIAPRVSDSEHRWLIRLTQNGHLGSECNPVVSENSNALWRHHLPYAFLTRNPPPSFIVDSS